MKHINKVPFQINALKAHFQAGLCNDAETNLMGESIDTTKKGTFYLRTNAQAPYAMPFISATTRVTVSSIMHVICMVFVMLWIN